MKTIKFKDWVKEAQIKRANAWYQRLDEATRDMFNYIFKTYEK